MKTVLKIALGIILAFVVLIVGCVAIIGGTVDNAVDEVQKESDKTSITQAEYQSVKVGTGGNSRARIVARFGEPQSQQDIQTGDVEGIPDSASGLECIYYNREGKIASLYQFCIDSETGRVQSKSAF
jgi:hypothetical protein